VHLSFNFTTHVKYYYLLLVKCKSVYQHENEPDFAYLLLLNVNMFI
jgi:hypothetical protein